MKGGLNNKYYITKTFTGLNAPSKIILSWCEVGTVEKTKPVIEYYTFVQIETYFVNMQAVLIFLSLYEAGFLTLNLAKKKDPVVLLACH